MSERPAKAKPHVPQVDLAWLGKRLEAPIPATYSVVDSHFHLWDYSDPPYYGDSYVGEAQAAGITSSVYVECSMGYREDGPDAERVVGEVEFARDQAERFSTPRFHLAEAIVGAADVRLGAQIARVLEQEVVAGAGRFRGIRIRAAHDDDPEVSYGSHGADANLLQQPSSLAALAVLRDLGLVLDLYLFHTQLERIAELARALPDLPIVLNHFGTPLGAGQYAARGDEVVAAWRKGIEALRPYENVTVKIGGFAISRVGLVRRDGRIFPPSSEELAETFSPWLNHCLESFGARRCMFGSNFPVDKVAMSLTTQVNAMKRLAARLSPDEAAALMGGTARRIYRLSTAAPS
jgi:L-fuconolactonase